MVLRYVQTYNLSTISVGPSSQIPGPLRGSPVKAIAQHQWSAPTH